MAIPENLFDLPPEIILDILNRTSEADRDSFANTSRRAALLVQEYNRHATAVEDHRTGNLLEWIQSLTRGHDEL
jgi:hypothetical protein